jgi:hypothetical protein
LFAGGTLLGVCEGEVFLFFFFYELFGDVFVDVEARFGCGFEGGEVCLDAVVELFGELPDGFVGLGVEVVVLFLLFVVEYLEGLDQFVDLFCVHPL